MASIDVKKIGTTGSIPAGATHTFQWNNPHWNSVLAYFAYPKTPAPSGEHGTKTGTVAITKVECTFFRSNAGSDHKHVTIHIENTGPHATTADIYQSWMAI